MKTCLIFVAALVVPCAVWMNLPRAKQFSLRGGCAIVTGGSYGIGPKIATELANRSVARVVLMARSEAKLEAQASSLRQQHPEVDVQVAVADFKDSESSVAALAEITSQDCPGDWILIHNAALAHGKSLLSFSKQDIEDTYRVNALTPIHMTRYMLELMREKTRGHVVFISSLTGVMSHPYMSVYASTKAALTNLGKSVRAELFHAGLSNVTLNVVNVGPVLEVGAYASMDLTIHDWYGYSTAEDVAVATADAIEENAGSVICSTHGPPFQFAAIFDLLCSGRTWEVQAAIPGAPALPILDQYLKYSTGNQGPITSRK